MTTTTTTTLGVAREVLSETRQEQDSQVQSDTFEDVFVVGVPSVASDSSTTTTTFTSEQVKARLDAQLAKMRLKDKKSKQLSKEDLSIIYEDDHVIVVDKPSGVLTVSGNNEFPSLAQAVYEALQDDDVCDLVSADRMIVHRLGMDTSGLIVMAKDMEAVRGLNTVFRNRQVERKYEALVCGHMEKDRGIIDLPIMRDYEFPPYVRISTDDHQRVLLDIDPEVVGKKILEGPKESITEYEVVSREELDGNPVTRVSLSSISGRYHQLNVHLVAFGHPIVGDTTYGLNGYAASNGGLTDEELESLAPNPQRASRELQKAISKSAKFPCVHAKSLKFRHPVTDEDVLLTSDAPF